jgi:hypothetical protein
LGVSNFRYNKFWSSTLSASLCAVFVVHGVKIQVLVFCVATLRSFAVGHQRFGGPWFLHIQGEVGEALALALGTLWPTSSANLRVYEVEPCVGSWPDSDCKDDIFLYSYKLYHLTEIQAGE